MDPDCDPSGIIYIGRLQNNPDVFGLVHLNDRGANCHNFLLDRKGLVDYIQEASEVKRAGKIKIYNGIPYDVRRLDKEVYVDRLSSGEFLHIKELAGLESKFDEEKN